MRGITIAGMILVNNPGSEHSIYVPLEHSLWNGITPTDLVFPFFIFIMGASMFLSYKKFDFKFTRQTFTKLLRRSVLLFFIGLALNWLGHSYGYFNELHNSGLSFGEKLWKAATDFENVRILGVLQRLALVSFFGSLVVLLVRVRFIPWLIAIILLLYWLLIGLTNSFAETNDSIVAVIDRLVLGVSHMYSEGLPDGSIIHFDPEGVLGVLPSIAHVLLGFLAGKMIAETKDNNLRIQKLFLFGTIILFVGYLLSYGFPINKKIWSSSYVLVTSGLASLLLAVLIWFIDIKGNKRWSVFFESFGVNPMFVYVFAYLMNILIGNLTFNYNGQLISAYSFVNTVWIVPVFGDYFGSVVYALLFVGISWMIGNILYKKKIYIKL
jgi:predicted acyltransferase